MEGKEKLNILVLSWRGPGHPNAGGAEVSTHEHAKKWVEAGHNVTLFTSFFKSAKKMEKIDGINIIRAGSQFFGVHWEAFKWYRFNSHPKFDLVVDQFHGIPFFTPLYIKEKKLGFIHEVTKEVWKLNQFPIPFNFFVSVVGILLEPLIFKLYKRIYFMTVSESTKRDLIEWGIPKENIVVVHNGVNVPKIIIPKKEKIKTITFLGALAKDKGIEQTIQVFHTLEKHSPNQFQFWVIGKSDNRYLQSLKLQLHKLGLNNVKFWGYVDENTKFKLLARSHILINPSIREGWGIVVIEGASMGTPTIAFNVPGLKDSVVNGKTGMLCLENTVENLATIVLKILTHKKMYKEMSRNAILWSKNFSWDKSTKQSLDFIRQLAEN